MRTNGNFALSLIQLHVFRIQWEKHIGCVWMLDAPHRSSMWIGCLMYPCRVCDRLPSPLQPGVTGVFEKFPFERAVRHPRTPFMSHGGIGISSASAGGGIKRRPPVPEPLEPVADTPAAADAPLAEAELRNSLVWLNADRERAVEHRYAAAHASARTRATAATRWSHSDAMVRTLKEMGLPRVWMHLVGIF